MIRLQSIRSKLQWWVAIIFVLTGTAGWAGIWGLLYISRTTKEFSGEQMRRAEDASAIQASLNSVRHIDREYWLAAAMNDTVKQKEQSAKLTAGWAAVGDRIKQIRDDAGRGAGTLDGLATAHVQVVVSWGTIDNGTPKPFAELQQTAYVEHQRRVAELEKQVDAVAGGSFSTIKTQTGKLYDWIWILQVALFITVALCQGFSAWAGWKLSKTLVGELGALKDNAEKISMGDLKNEVAVMTNDAEIVALAEAIDRLRVSLGKAMDRLTAKRAGPQSANKPAEA